MTDHVAESAAADDPAERQVGAAKALVAVVAAGWGLGLPRAYWEVSEDGRRIAGHLQSADAPGLAAWAEAFGAEVAWDRHDGRHPQAEFVVNTVAVRVWTAMAPAQPAGGEV